MGRSVLVVTAVAVVVVLVASSAIVFSLNAREVRLTSLINWTGWVELGVPESFLDGFSGLYVSNTSSCGYVLPSYWIGVGGYVWVLFNSSVPLYSGREEVFWLCYGDVVVPLSSPPSCALGSGCVFTAVNATVDGRTISVKVDNTLREASNTTSGEGDRAQSTIVFNKTIVPIRVESTLNTSINQSYVFSVYLDGRRVYEATVTPSEATASLNVSTNYDTGVHYYDTGVYTVYDFGSERYVEAGQLVINVYDSDRDTYYVYVYLDGSQYARYYQRSSITVDLSGKTFRTVAVRVYDTERNDYVRAYGSFRATTLVYTARAGATLDGSIASRNVTVVWSGESVFDYNLSTTVKYYEVKHVEAIVEVSPPSNSRYNYVAVVREPRLNFPSKPVSYRATVGQEGGATRLVFSLEGGAAATLSLEAYSGSRWDTHTYPLDERALVWIDPSTISANLAGLGETDTMSGEWNHTLGNLTVRVDLYAGVPGAYNLSIGVQLYTGLVNYTNLYIGSEKQPSGGGGGGSSGGGNTTVIVNVGGEAWDKMFTYTYIVGSMGVAGLALYLFFIGLRENKLYYPIIGFTLLVGDSLSSFALGFELAARGFIMLAAIVILYPVLERLVDTLLRKMLHKRW